MDFLLSFLSLFQHFVGRLLVLFLSYCRRSVSSVCRLFGFFGFVFYFVACVCVALAYSLVEGVIFFGINRFTFGFSLKLKHRIAS